MIACEFQVDHEPHLHYTIRFIASCFLMHMHPHTMSLIIQLDHICSVNMMWFTNHNKLVIVVSEFESSLERRIHGSYQKGAYVRTGYRSGMETGNGMEALWVMCFTFRGTWKSRKQKWNGNWKWNGGFVGHVLCIQRQAFTAPSISVYILYTISVANTRVGKGWKWGYHAQELVK